MGTLLYNHNVVADGAAFGQILSKYQVEYTLGKINFVLPESFEWLLLQSEIFEGITGKVEELENGAHGYSKSGDMRCFLQDCCYKDILKLLGVEL